MLELELSIEKRIKKNRAAGFLVIPAIIALALVISKVFIDHLNIFFSPGGQSNFPKKIEFYSGFTYFKCVLQLLDLAIVPSIRICNDF